MYLSVKCERQHFNLSLILCLVLIISHICLRHFILTFVHQSLKQFVPMNILLFFFFRLFIQFIHFACCCCCLYSPSHEFTVGVHQLMKMWSAASLLNTNTERREEEKEEEEEDWCYEQFETTIHLASYTTESSRRYTYVLHVPSSSLFTHPSLYCTSCRLREFHYAYHFFLLFLYFFSLSLLLLQQTCKREKTVKCTSFSL